MSPLISLNEVDYALRILREKAKADFDWPRQLQEKFGLNLGWAAQQAACTTPDITPVHPQTETTPPPAEITPQKLARHDKSPAVPRENDLHIFIERVCKKLMAEQKRYPKARDVFNAIRKRTEEFDEDCIIVRIENYTIEWKSLYSNIDTMKMVSLANRISKIKRKLMKNNHR